MLRIGQLASRTGFTPKTLRYYEDLGLVRPDGRSESGYRLYADAAVERLRFVNRARALGLRLEDIRRILEISDEGRNPCEHVQAVVDRELDRIAAQMKRLQEFRNGLLTLRSRMATAPASGTARPGQPCPCFQEDASESAALEARAARERRRGDGASIRAGNAPASYRGCGELA
jgi:MerR family transcriptional regulator, Zn(II)-responsive regulator of zntA